MVRYYGCYSSRTRGSEHEHADIDSTSSETDSKAVGLRWAKLIRKVYEVDPLVCPECGAQMRVTALIEDPVVIERILSWLGLWDPWPACGPSPPGEHATPLLSYHPVPDIA
jgi:hypothetical protein